MTPVEVVFARTIWLDVALQCGDQLHGVLHRRYPGPCTFQPGMLVQQVSHGPAAAWDQPEKWAAEYRVAFERHHRTFVAWRVADCILTDCSDVLDVDRLAGDFATSPAVLRREFRRAFGISPRAFHLHDQQGEEEAWTLAHAFLDLEESFRRFTDKHLPTLLTSELDSKGVHDLLIEIGEEFRHILYHIGDPKFYRYLPAWGGAERDDSQEDNQHDGA